MDFSPYFLPVAVAAILVAMILLFTSLLTVLMKMSDETTGDELADVKNTLRRGRIALVLSFTLAGVLFLAVKYIPGSGLEGHIQDWLNLIIRWAHVILGISWIGASFYFIFLENSLNRTENLRDELAGNLWAVHGGGFYYVEKYKVSPKELPKKLHWFKYEAYYTWLTGILLLSVVYYMNAKSFMVDPSVRDISAGMAVLIGIGTIVSGWFVYDILCRTPLLHKKQAFAFVGFGIVVLYSIFLTQYLSGRAAFIHIGALLGTVMAGNVFFVIIPSQKELVAAAKEGRPVNPELGKLAGLRSLHNNYITLPVIFIMISNHFPATFGHTANWAILAGLTLASVAVRHYLNLHEKGQLAVRMIPFAAVAIFALIVVTSPKATVKNTTPISFAEVEPIFKDRCTVCHSFHPTDDVQKIAPGGVMFDTKEQIQKMAPRILVRAVQTATMPQGNKTKITDDEREKIGRWIEQGAK